MSSGIARFKSLMHQLHQTIKNQLILNNRVLRRTGHIGTIYQFFRESYHCATTLLTEIYAIAFYSINNYFCGYKKKFHYYGLNPTELTDKQAEKPAVIFLHGQKHNQSGCLPLALSLHKAGIGPVFTLNLKYNETHPHIHEDKLRKKIMEIRDLYASKGKNSVNLYLIGHSRGGTEALNYLCSHNHHLKHVKVKKIITIAARICVGNPHPRWRSCPVPLRNLVCKVNKEIQGHKHVLYHIVSNKDWVVALDNALINRDADHFHIIENRSHLGILYAAETHNKVIDFIRD